MSVERSLAEFTVDLTPSDVPPSVAEHVGLVVGDTVGAIIGGVATTDVDRLIKQLDDVSTTSEATVFGRPERLSASDASLVHGIAGTSLELDEGHKLAAGHPAIHIIPALFATHDRHDEAVQGAKLATALVTGYEVGVRVAEACQPLGEGYHPHGVWGTVAGVAALANYLNLDVEVTTEALRMAPNHAQHTHFDAAKEGRTIRNTYAGMTGPDVLTVTDLAIAGFTGLDNGLNAHLDRACAQGFGPVDTESLGKRWTVEGGYFKIHAACRYTHPALDAIDTLDNDIDLNRPIATITVETFSTAATLTETRPETPLAARFSLPFVVGTRIHHGHASKEAFEPSSMTDEVYDLASKTEVVETDEFEAALPDARGARVVIEFADGTAHAETVPQARGGGRRPFEEPQLRDKFHTLVDPVLEPYLATELWSTIREISHQRDISFADMVVPRSE